MLRLRHIVLFTTDQNRLREFYEERVGLEPSVASPHWTAYRTGGAILALHPLAAGADPEAELSFETADLEATMREMEGRGARFREPIQDQQWSAQVRLRDPEGNRLALVQPKVQGMEAEGPEISVAMIHAQDLDAARAFYRGAMGLVALVDTPSRIQLDTGATALILVSRTDRLGAPRGLRIEFAMPQLPLWVDDARARGLAITPVADHGFGLFANTTDPDGHPITFRDAVEPVTEEERLAEPFEDDGAPVRAPFRKPPKKGSKAVSRIAVGLGFAGAAAKQKAAQARPAAKHGATQRVSSARGSGPAGSRAKPKRTADPKRARAKPAIGRLKKAERRTLAQHKRAVASASKGKPVKRAASRAKGKRSGRAAARGGKRS